MTVNEQILLRLLPKGNEKACADILCFFHLPPLTSLNLKSAFIFCWRRGFFPMLAPFFPPSPFFLALIDKKKMIGYGVV